MRHWISEGSSDENGWAANAVKRRGSGAEHRLFKQAGLLVAEAHCRHRWQGQQASTDTLCVNTVLAARLVYRIQQRVRAGMRKTQPLAKN